MSTDTIENPKPHQPLRQVQVIFDDAGGRIGCVLFEITSKTDAEMNEEIAKLMEKGGILRVDGIQGKVSFIPKSRIARIEVSVFGEKATETNHVL